FAHFPWRTAIMCKALLEFMDLVVRHFHFPSEFQYLPIEGEDQPFSFRRIVILEAIYDYVRRLRKPFFHLGHASDSALDVAHNLSVRHPRLQRIQQVSLPIQYRPPRDFDLRNRKFWGNFPQSKMTAVKSAFDH